MDKVAFKTLKGLSFLQASLFLHFYHLACDGDLLFRQSSQPVATEEIRSMSNSTLAGSPKGCARACFSAQNCHVICVLLVFN
jgi:hypothetical protein